jgi:hypothetical protein
MNKTKELPICYLCGKEIIDGNISREHVPPKQLFPSEIRKKHNINLSTFPSHFKCNKEYQNDEDYFFSTLAPLTEKADVHPYVLNDLAKKLKRNEGNKLLLKILGEFKNDSPIILPGNQIAKRIDRRRIGNIGIKIIKGLYWKHFGKVLENIEEIRLDIYQAYTEPNDMYKIVLSNQELYGEYCGIFCYKFNMFGFVENKQNWQMWSLMIWDSFAIVCAFREN